MTDNYISFLILAKSVNIYPQDETMIGQNCNTNQIMLKYTILNNILEYFKIMEKVYEKIVLFLWSYIFIAYL